MQTARKILLGLLSVGMVACSSTTTLSPANPSDDTDGNLPPVPRAESIETLENTQGTAKVEPNDPDDEIHTFAVGVAPEHGQAFIGADGIAVYIPAASYVGKDSFQIDVMDPRGGKGATIVKVTIAKSDAQPSDIVTYKNTPVDAFVMENGLYTTFQNLTVKTAPAHGTADLDVHGLLHYVPAEGFDGTDSVTLSLGEGADAVDFKRVIKVINREPQPSVTPLVSTGAIETVSVMANDPDPRDTATFSLVGAPVNGAASVNTDGELSYTPDAGFVGSDFATVRVSDGSGDSALLIVPVTVMVGGFAAPSVPGGDLPASLCGDGYNRVVFSAATPASGAGIPVAATTAVTATIAYSFAEAITVTILREFSPFNGPTTWGTADTRLVGPGCATYTISVPINEPDYGEVSLTFVAPLTGAGNDIRYQVGGPGVLTHVESVGLPLGTVIGEPTYRLDVIASFSSLEGLLFVAAEESTGDGEFSAAIVSLLPNIPNLPLHLRGTVACGETFTQFGVGNMASESDYVNLIFPAHPPRLTVDNFLEKIPVPGAGEYKAQFRLSTCAATAETVTLSAPAWASLSYGGVTASTLQVTAPTDGAGIAIDVIVHGGALSPGALTQNQISLALTDATVHIPLSARRFDIAWQDYTRLGLDTQSEVQYQLPFTLNTGTMGLIDTITVSSIGSIGLAGNCSPNTMLGAATMGPMTLLYAFGGLGDCDAIEPWMGAHIFKNPYAGAITADVYARNVTQGVPQPYVELLYWDLQVDMAYDSHNVIKVRIYADGSFAFEYLMIDPLGMEGVGYHDAYGRTGPLTYSGLLRDGDIKQYAPIPFSNMAL